MPFLEVTLGVADHCLRQKKRPKCHTRRTGSSSSKTDEIYTTLRFSFHSLRVHSVDIEWLLSTLFRRLPVMTWSRPRWAASLLRVSTLHLPGPQAGRVGATCRKPSLQRILPSLLDTSAVQGHAFALA